MKKNIAVYLRVSTTGQDVKSQEPDLKAWLRARGRGRSVLWYRDRFTGATLERPGMRKLEADIRSDHHFSRRTARRRRQVRLAPGRGGHQHSDWQAHADHHRRLRRVRARG